MLKIIIKMSNTKKLLRVKEPYGGWDKFDTGLGNRILHWEVAYKIMELSGYNFELAIEDRYWPEIIMVDIPYTYPVFTTVYDSFIEPDYRFLTYYDEGSEDVKMSTPITLEDVKNIILKNDYSKFTESDDFYTDFGFHHLTNFIDYETVQKSRPLHQIRLKHFFIEYVIKENVANAVGIHIRRGSGVNYDNIDLSKLPEDLVDEINTIRKRTNFISCKTYNYFDNETYFEVMDHMLKLNPNQKFYISHDLMEINIEPFKNRYGDSLVDVTILRQVVHRYLISSKIGQHLLDHGNTLNNIVDIFSLSFCPFMIGSPSSTWSDFARARAAKKYINIDKGTDKIIELYKDFINYKLI